MINPLTLASLVLAMFVFLSVADRLRLINWHTAKPRCVAAHLMQIALALWVIYDVFTAGVGIFQTSMLVLDLAWLLLTRDHWRDGPPPSAKADRGGSLGEPEFERFR